MINKYLFEICSIQYGFAFKSNLFSKNEGIPVIRIRDVKRGYTETYTTEPYDKAYMVKHGDILVGMDGEFNISKWGRDSALLNQRVCKLVAKQGVDENYIFLFLSRELRKIENNTPCVTVKHLTAKQLNSILVPLPNFALQQKIGYLFITISKLIVLRQKQLSKLDELVKSRFVEMFGDPKSNNKNWNTLKLGDLCSIVRGGSPRPIEKYLGGNIPWIKIGDATKSDNIYLKNTKQYIIEDGIKKSRLVKSGSLIFANCGVSLGFARIITFQGCIHDGWLAFENVNDKIDRVFLLLSLNHMTEYFRAIAPDGTQPNLNTSIMKNYKQIVPPLQLQKSYVSFIEQTNKIISQIQKSLDELETLKSSLMQKYFG